MMSVPITDCASRPVQAARASPTWEDPVPPVPDIVTTQGRKLTRPHVFSPAERRSALIPTLRENSRKRGVFFRPCPCVERVDPDGEGPRVRLGLPRERSERLVQVTESCLYNELPGEPEVLVPLRAFSFQHALRLLPLPGQGEQEALGRATIGSLGLRPRASPPSSEPRQSPLSPCHSRRC